MRALAILSVVAWHYLGIGDGPASTPWRIFMAGRSGVDLFFVLSGYLITGILLANADAPNYFSSFYGRRSFRILPIYGIMLAIYLIGRKLGGSAPILFGGPLPWWSYAIGLQNIWMTIHQNYGAAWLAGTWSLAIEEQFYLIFPLVIYLLPSRMLPRLLIALLVLAPLGRMIAGGFGDRFGYYVLMPLRADILAIGALIAWLEFFRLDHPIRSPDFSGRVLVQRLFLPGLRLGRRPFRLHHDDVGPYLSGGALRIDGLHGAGSQRRAAACGSQKPFRRVLRPHFLRALPQSHQYADFGLPRGGI